MDLHDLTGGSGPIGENGNYNYGINTSNGFKFGAGAYGFKFQVEINGDGICDAANDNQQQRLWRMIG
jgi:hypothetical protein